MKKHVLDIATITFAIIYVICCAVFGAGLFNILTSQHYRAGSVVAVMCGLGAICICGLGCIIENRFDK